MSSQDHPPPNPTEPYQPYLDSNPPPSAPISNNNGSIISPAQKQQELLNESTKAEREATPEPDEPHIEFPKDLPTPPFIHVQGIPNFRDLGGYQSTAPPNAPANKNYQLRKGFLYRCAHPTHLTEKGLETLTEQLGVTTFYDLRSQPEISRLAATVTNSPKTLYPLADPTTGTIEKHTTAPTLSRVFVPVYQSEDYGPVALATKLQWYTASHQHSPELGYEYSEGFVQAYRDIAAHGAGAYTSIFRHILERHNEPLVFHCTAGKDRTGVFGALIMKLVGVDEDTICWEYALTEPGLGRWREQFIQRISKSGLGGASSGGGKPQVNEASQESPEKIYTGGNGISREEAARICGSRAGNMRAWLTTVLEGEFGGVEKYLTEKCGLSADEIQRLKQILSVEVSDPGQITRKTNIPRWTPEGGVED